MTQSATVTIRVDAELKKRLEAVAKSQQRSKSFVAATALTDYINMQEAQVAGINKALAELDRDGGIAHTKVVEWIESWDTNNEHSRP